MPTDEQLRDFSKSSNPTREAERGFSGARISNAGIETLFSTSSKASTPALNVQRCLKAYGGKLTKPVRLQETADKAFRRDRNVKFDVLRKLHERSNAGSVSLREVSLAFDECTE